MPLLKNKKLAKTLKWIAISIASLILALVIFIVLALTVFEDKICNIAINKMNQNLLTEIYMDDMDLTIFPGFPQISIRCSNIIVDEALDSTKTSTCKLAQAEYVYFQFKLFDIIKGNYTINTVVIENANLNLKIFEDASNNYKIVESKSGKDSNQQMLIDISKIRLKNVHVYYNDYKRNQQYVFTCLETGLKGKFSSDIFDLDIDGDFYIDSLSVDNINYLKDEDVILNTKLNINKEIEKYTISDASMLVNDIVFIADGYVNDTQDDRLIDLTVVGDQVDLYSLLCLIPDNYSVALNNFTTSGNLAFTLNIKGSLKLAKPQITAKLVLNNGEVIYEDENLNLKNVSINANFNSIEIDDRYTYAITLNTFSFLLNDGMFDGNIEIIDIQKPAISGELNTNINVKDLLKIVDIKQMQLANKGKMNLNLKFDLKLTDIKNINKNDLLNAKLDGSLQISGLDCYLKNSLLNYKNVNCDIAFNDKEIALQNLSANIEDSDISIKGNILNLLPWFFIDNEKLELVATLSSDYVIVDQLINSQLHTDIPLSNNSKAKVITIPNDIYADLNLDIKNLSYDKFFSSNNTGQLVLNNGQISVNSLKMRCMDGSIKLNARMSKAEQGYYVEAYPYATNVNISRLFYQFHNFGVKGLTNENISGFANVDIALSLYLSDDFKPIRNTIYAYTDFIVNNGELKNFKPLMSLSPYLKNTDLSYIKFEEMNNNIIIQNDSIFIPQMDIYSSAADVRLSGVQSFNGDIDYSVGVYLSQIINSNSKQEDVSEFGYYVDQEKEKQPYYFRLTGTINDIKVKLVDLGAYKEDIKENIKTEKEDIINDIKEEFSINKDKNPKDTIEEDFTIEWD